MYLNNSHYTTLSHSSVSYLFLHQSLFLLFRTPKKMWNSTLLIPDIPIYTLLEFKSKNILFLELPNKWVKWDLLYFIKLVISPVISKLFVPDSRYQLSIVDDVDYPPFIVVVVVVVGTNLSYLCIQVLTTKSFQ